MKNVVVIPARLDSTRLKRKLLLSLGEKPVICWSVERALESQLSEQVIVATDSGEIKEAVKDYPCNVILTSSHPTCGSERIWEAIKGMEIENIVNLQADEPFLPGWILDKVFAHLEKGEEMVTVGIKDYDLERFKDENCVKIVVDSNQYALYFSRAFIPFCREENHPFYFLRHIGVYGYKKKTLEKFINLPDSYYEKIEKLEQLRALYYRIKIKVEILEEDIRSISIDTQKDLEEARKFIRDGGL